MALNYEKKRFLDCIKVFTCNLTEAMCRLLLKYYDRRKDILPALSMIVERAGEVKLEDGEPSYQASAIPESGNRLCRPRQSVCP